MADEGWEPNILVFCCNWCSYAGADLAGVARLQMPTPFRVLRVAPRVVFQENGVVVQQGHGGLGDRSTEAGPAEREASRPPPGS